MRGPGRSRSIRTPTPDRGGGASERHRADWEELAELDAKWAILGDPRLRGGGWDANVAEFFASGERELDDFVASAAAAGVEVPDGCALDFGCGIGRITWAMAARFGRAVGMDHSAEMVRQAAGARPDAPLAPRFRQAANPPADETFDLVWCRLVVQHQPSTAAAERLLADLARCVAPGGVLNVQMPVVLSLRRRLQPRRRAYRLLRMVGVPHRTLFHRLGLNPIRMVAVPRTRVEAILRSAGLRVVVVREAEVAAGQVDADVTARRPRV